MEAKAYTRPQVTPEEAMRAVVERFSLPVTQVKELPSEIGLRFLLQEEALGRNYILEVSPAEEDPEVLDFKNRMLEHLDRAGFSLPKALYAFDGNEIVELPGPEGENYPTRLLTWVPGAVLADVTSQTPGLFRSLGTFLGKLDSALEDFSHPAQDRELKWDLKGAGRVVRSNLEYVEDEERRELLEEMSQRFLEQLGPLVPDLRMSVINAGTNDLNVLVEEPGEAAGPGNRQVIGVSDFGDAVRSYTAGEVAIGASYAMLGKADPFSAATHVVEGYHEAYPLNDAEIEALYPLMGLRLCACLAIAAHQKTLESDSESLAIDEAAAWALLEKLEGESVTFPHLLFRQACGLDPMPNSSAEDWLKEHGEEAAPVVGEEALSAVPLHVLDFSIGSGEFGLTPEPEDAAGWTDLIFQKMKAVGAEVGVGRYDEVRRWYTSDIFQAPTDDTPEWRTVHIGVDLFLAAGSPVFSPFDAVVHSVGHNEGDLDYGPAVILEHRVTDGVSDHGKAPKEEANSGGGDPDGTLKFWTLYGHLGESVLTDLTPGQTIAKGEAFAEIGDFPVNGNWAPHLHFQILTDTLEKEGNFPGVARPSQRALWKALSPDPNLILDMPDPGDRAAQGGRDLMNPERPGPAEVGTPSGVPLKANAGHSEEENLKLRSEYLGANLSLAYEKPLKIVRGVGQYLYDSEGQAYLDCVNNVSSVGHNHPSVVAAGLRQMAILNTNTRYLHDLLVEYAEELVALLPGQLSKVFFVNSGSEANELALRMARTHTKQKDVVVVEGADHGSTSTMAELSPCKFDGPGGDGAPDWVHKVPLPDPFRGSIRARPEGEASEEPASPPAADEVGPAYAEQLLQVLNQMGAEGRQPSAFFCESILESGGQIVLPDGFMTAAFDYAREAGAVCIADEIQMGFGRAGTHFWAFETQGVEPDILTLGRPIGNGHPLGAVITTPEIAESFDTGMEYFSSFGGNPVSCAIGLAVLDVIREENLQQNARTVGDHLLAGLREVQSSYPIIGDVRGLGLNIGVEMVSDPESREPDAEKANRVMERLRDHHLLLSTDGPDGNVLKIKPPMVFTTENADRLVETLERILSEEASQG